MTTAASPCPFCGSRRIGCHSRKSGRKSGYQCMCLACGIRQGGAFHSDIDHAILAWNTRASVEPATIQSVVEIVRGVDARRAVEDGSNAGEYWLGEAVNALLSSVE